MVAGKGLTPIVTDDTDSEQTTASEDLIKSLKIPQGRPKAKALGYQPRSLWATCGVAEATPFRNRDL